MKKIRKITARGTGIREAEYEEAKWSGDTYREEQKKRLEKIPKDLTIHLGRGTRTIKAGDLPEPSPRPSTEGRTRITARGTSRRKSKNKGSPK